MSDLLLVLVLGVLKVVWFLTAGALIVVLSALWVIVAILSSVFPPSRPMA